MSEYWNAILRTPYRFTGVGLTLAQQQRHDYKVSRAAGLEFAKSYGVSGYVPSERGVPLALAWKLEECPDPGTLAAFSVKNQHPGRIAYLRQNAKAADKALWAERVAKVPTHSTDGFIAEQCGWTVSRHGAMSNGRVHWPVIVDCGGDDIFLTLPRQIGDGQDETLKREMIWQVPFEEFEAAYIKSVDKPEETNG